MVGTSEAVGCAAFSDVADGLCAVDALARPVPGVAVLQGGDGQRDTAGLG